MYSLSTTDTLRVTTDAAATLDVLVDSTTTNAGVITVNAPEFTKFSTATTTTVAAAPGAGIKNVKRIGIRNTHATLAVSVTVFRERSATAYEDRKETLQPGDHLTLDEGVGFFRSAASSSTRLGRLLSADATGQNIATAQPWFPSSGAVTVAANTTYYFYGSLSLTRAAGVTSHTTSLLFGGTATLTSIYGRCSVNVSDVETTSTDGTTTFRVATATVVKAASTSATEAISLIVAGIVRINAAGTFIPQFQYSAIPGGAPTVKANTYFFMEPNGSGALTAIGTWT